MWLFTNFGFFSAVQKPGESDLTIRARAKKDLELLREKYLPSAGEVIQGEGTDYPYRVRVTHEAFAEALRQIALDIEYSNFKSEVGRTQGAARAHAYSKVWQALLNIEKEEDDG